MMRMGKRMGVFYNMCILIVFGRFSRIFDISEIAEES